MSSIINNALAFNADDAFENDPYEEFFVAPRMKPQVEHHHGERTDELTLLMTGSFKENAKPFVVSDKDGCNSISFHSQTEAIDALMVALTRKYDGDEEKIRNDYRQSSLYTGIAKWNSPNGKWENLSIKDWPYAMTEPAYDAECEKQYPVIPLRETAGPVFDDLDLYGVIGQVTRKICENSEAYKPAVYLNLIVTLGCAFDRAAYFNVDGTKHFTIDFLACVGDSSTGRKGTSADAANSFLRAACGSSLARNLGGFGSPQGVIDQIKDASEYRQRDRKTNTYKIMTVLGVPDKRLCIRENELSSLFKLISDPKTKAAELFRDLWDSKPAQNHVAGKFDDGSSRSLKCDKPHVAIVGSSTPSLVKMTLPVGADKSGDGNRFIWCYTKRTQLCPHGGPQIDWQSETVEYAGETVKIPNYMQRVFQHARQDMSGAFRERLIPQTKAASKFWTHLYLRLENDQRATFLGFMTARAAAHIRRLAMIFALVDLEDAVDVRHLKAAEAIWNYSQESARFIFKGYSLDQEKILRFAEGKGVDGITVNRDLHELFNRHKSGEWLRAQVRNLLEGGYLVRSGEKYTFKKY